MVEQEWWSRNGGARMVEQEWWSKNGRARMVEQEWWSKNGGAGIVEQEWWSKNGHIVICMRVVHLNDSYYTFVFIQEHVRSGWKGVMLWYHFI